MNIGDKVVIVRSPYSSVRAGTIATITRMRLNHLGPGKHLYYLSLSEYKSFWGWEIKKV